MERGDLRRDGRGSLHYNSRETFSENDAKRARHSSLKKSVHKKHSRHHHQRYSSASDADAKRASYEENPHNWSECDSSQGRKYWFNIRTEKSQWEVPKAILLKRSKEKDANSRTGRDHFSPSNSERRRGQNSHSSDHHFNSPLDRDEEMDTSSHPTLSSISNNSSANAAGTGSQNLITSLHPLQQALLVKNQLEHSTQSNNNNTVPFNQSALTSPNLPFRPNESSFSLPNPTNSINSFDNIPSLPSLGRLEIRPHGSVKFPTTRGVIDGQNNTTSSHLDKFANTPGIRIKKKPTISTSSEGSFKFSTNCTVTPVADIAIPESSIELHCDTDLMNSSLIYPFTSPDLDYLEKELNQKMSQKLDTTYVDNLDSQLLLTKAKMNWEIDNCFSQIYSLRASNLASLIDSNQLSNS